MENEQSEMGILLVDDEAQTLKYFRRAFENEFRIFTATSADDGINILKEHSDSIAILITDQRMPEKRGVELLKFARSEYSDIVRILTTGYTDLEEAIEAVNSGEIHRYITKPWDLSALQLELRQSMQFFQIRRERDVLLREKLSARQRMEGVNRVRELVAMASGFTATRNPLLAVQLFLEQIPVASAGNPLKGKGGWSQVLEDVEKISNTGSTIAGEVAKKRADSLSSVSINELWAGVNGSGIELNQDLGKLGEVSIELDLELTKWAVESILSWLSASSESPKIDVKGIDRDEAIELQIVMERGSWGETSILDFPSELLGAYFVVSHYRGRLRIGAQKEGVFMVSIELPKLQEEQVDVLPDLSWLENVLSRFENW